MRRKATVCEAGLGFAVGVVAVAFGLAWPATAQVSGPPWVTLDHRVWPSPRAAVTQVIGVSEVTVRYSRPAVKERDVWQQIVPEGRVWRGGADWNTTLELSDDVRLEGQELAAGKYGLHFLPHDGRFTVIVSRFGEAWGSFSYQESEDVLRLEVEAKPAAHQEWLHYGFSDLSADAATLSLRWAQIELPLRIEVDTHGIALARFRDGFRSLSGFTWMGYANAARYCLDNEVALEEGLGWAEKALADQVSYDTLALKALLLQKLGRGAEVDPLLDRALELATPTQVRFLAGRLLREAPAKQAVRLLARAAERHPTDWRMHHFHGRALAADQQQQAARRAFAQALDLAPAASRAVVDRQLSALDVP